MTIPFTSKEVEDHFFSSTVASALAANSARLLFTHLAHAAVLAHSHVALQHLRQFLALALVLCHVVRWIKFAVPIFLRWNESSQKILIGTRYGLQDLGRAVGSLGLHLPSQEVLHRGLATMVKRISWLLGCMLRLVDSGQPGFVFVYRPLGVEVEVGHSGRQGLLRATAALTRVPNSVPVDRMRFLIVLSGQL